MYLSGSMGNKILYIKLLFSKSIVSRSHISVWQQIWPNLISKFILLVWWFLYELTRLQYSFNRPVMGGSSLEYDRSGISSSHVCGWIYINRVSILHTSVSILYTTTQDCFDLVVAMWVQFLSAILVFLNQQSRIKVDNLPVDVMRDRFCPDILIAVWYFVRLFDKVQLDLWT